MKVTCNREQLREGLAVVNSVVPAKSTKPVLENVCLVAMDNALEIVGTDLESSVRYRIDDVQVDEPGPVVVPARVTLDFVRDLTGDVVSLSTAEQNCFISSGEDTCELVTMDPEEFPVISRFGSEDTVPMQGGTFTKLVLRTSFAAAREAGRYAMHGVLTEIDNGMLRMVATDGRRLAMAEAPIDARNAPAKPVIVPTKGMSLFCRVIGDPLDQVHISFGENQIGLKTKNAEIFARLIDGEFPRYSAVIPRESKNAVEADTATLMQKLRLVANVTGVEARAVRLSMKAGEIELFGHSAGRGEARARLDADYKGEPADIAFNPDYVLDGLKNCEGQHVRLEFSERTSPGKFRLGENYIYIVMPITIEA